MKNLILDAIISFGFLFVAASFVSGQNVPKKLQPITGAFIQYNRDMIETANNPNGLSKADWESEMRAMQEIGMDTLILQFLELGTKSGNESYMTDENDKSAIDPTEAILTYADAHQMKVFIGLWNKEWGYDRIKNADPEMIAANKLNSKRVAETAWKRYGRHKAFYGWYLPQEIWNTKYSPEQNERMREMFRHIGEYCKGLDGNGKPTAISPYFSPSKDEDSEPEKVFTLLLKGDERQPGAKVDILMLQDGVGARCLEEKSRILPTVKPYFEQFYNAAKAAGVEFWSNVESFKTISGGCLDDFTTTQILRPTDISRLTAQIEASSILADDNQPMFKKIVTFDFFEFMSPVHKGENFKAREKLYRKYKKKFVPVPEK